MDTQSMPPNQTLTPSQGEQVMPTPSNASAPSSSAANAVKIENVDAKNSHQSWNRPIVLGISTWVLTLLLLLVFLPTSSWFAWRQLVGRYVFQSEYVTINNRIFDRNQYIVHSTRLNKPGFLVLFLGGEYDKGAKNPVAFTQRLLPGVYTNIQIRVDADRLVAEDPMMYGSGSSLYVALYYDDGDGIFNMINPNVSKDLMATDRFGNPVIVKLTIE